MESADDAKRLKMQRSHIALMDLFASGHHRVSVELLVDTSLALGTV